MNGLKDLLAHDKRDGNIVAVGEFGLDYARTKFCPIDIQKKLDRFLSFT